MPPFWKRPEPKKPESVKHEPAKPVPANSLQHAQELSEHLPGQAHKRTRKEMQLDAFGLDSEAHRLANEYMGLMEKHGSEARIPPATLQELHKRADTLRARQEVIRKEYEESS